MHYQFIDTNTGLLDFCSRLANAEYCAIDTEFVREKTYYPLLCLIQIATEAHCAALDPLAITDFSPLQALLQKPDLVKVFHSSSQDLEILYQQFGELPYPIYDTQLAAAVLGYSHQIGYADLVAQMTGTQLEKKYTRADWRRRPLSDDELDYAMDDVRYLLPVYRQLRDAIASKQRTSWLTKDLAALSDPAKYQADNSKLWQKLKGVQRLKGVALMIASVLCDWREQQAQKHNKPRRWIAADDWLIEIAKRQPIDQQQLGAIRDIPPKVMARYAQHWLALVKQALESDPSNWPDHPKVAPLSVQQQAIGDCIMALCRIAAEQNDIALATLVTRKDIDNFIINNKTSRLTQGWRFDMVGAQLLALMHSQNCLTIVQGKLQNQPFTTPENT